MTDSDISPPSPPAGSADSVWDNHFHDPEASAAQARATIETAPHRHDGAHGWCALTVGYYHLFYSTDPTVAGVWLDRAGHDFRLTGDRRGLLLAAVGQARLRLALGDALGAREALFELQDEARELPPRDRFYAISALAATFFYTDQLDQAIRHLYAALDVLRGLGPTPQLPTLLSNLAAVLVTVGDYEPARELAREALALMPRFNNPQIVLFARSNLAEALHGLGNRAEALEMVEAMLRDTEGNLVKSAQNHYCAISCEVLVGHGMLDRAERCLTAARAIFEAHPVAFNEVHYRWAEATIAAVRSPGAEALPLLHAAAEVATQRRHVSTMCKIYGLLAHRLAALGDYEQAYQCQQRLLEAQTRRLSDRASVKYYLLKAEYELVDTRAERDRAEAQRRQLETASRQLERLNKDLQRKVREVEELQARLREEAVHDPLTQLFNRRYLDSTMPRLIDAAARRSEPLAIVLLDLDYFKRVNDDYGHLAGDQVLMQLAQLFLSTLRGSDLVCRYGGEEFCLVLPGTSGEAAHALMTALAERVHELRVRYRNEELTAFTFSAGVAAFPAHGATAGELMLAADRALYAAKDAGRNCTLSAEAPR